VPILAFAMSRKGWARVLITLVAVSVLWRVGTGGTGQASEWIVGRVDQFVAGMAAASIVASDRKGRRQDIVRWLSDPATGPALALAAGAIALALGASQMLPKPLWFEATFHEVFGVLVAAFIVRLVCTDSCSFLANRGLVALGLVSYSLYLWHWPLMMEATTRVQNTTIALVGALGLTGIMTAVSYRFFEKPLIAPAPAAVRVSAPAARGRLAEAHR
jgi:peptidoglycan/LPS O-acetylase OafA/YrhL